MGDACKMLVAAEMTLAGAPALKMPDNWPHCDVIAQPEDGGAAQQLSVKSRTKAGPDKFADYWATHEFDWLAIVLLPGAEQLRRRISIILRDVADSRLPNANQNTLMTSIGDKIETAKSSQNTKTTFGCRESGLRCHDRSPTGTVDLRPQFP